MHSPLILGQRSHFGVIFWFKHIKYSYAPNLMSTFFTFNERRKKGTSAWTWKSQICWFPPCRQPNVCYIMLSCFIYIQPVHRLCICLSSPYHAVIIMLPNKQYLYIFWSSRLEECVAKSDHRYAIDFSKHIHVNSKNTNVLECCCAW